MIQSALFDLAQLRSREANGVFPSACAALFNEHLDGICVMRPQFTLVPPVVYSSCEDLNLNAGQPIMQLTKTEFDI